MEAARVMEAARRERWRGHVHSTNPETVKSRLKQAVKACIECGGRVTPTAVYCSVECRKAPKSRLCVVCSSEYVGTRNGRTVCSDRCHQSRKSARTKAIRMRRRKPIVPSMTSDAVESRRRAAIMECTGCGAPFSHVTTALYCKQCRCKPRDCVECGSEFLSTKIVTVVCSRACALSRGRRKSAASFVSVRETNPTIEKRCAHCVDEFSSNFMSERRRFCSTRCGNAHTKKVRRARKRGAFVEDIGLGYLMRRDRGCCQICGGRVEPNDDPLGNLYPSVDHIVPLVAGGLHERSNLQLAHRICNSIKGAGSHEDAIESMRGERVSFEG